MGRDNFEKKIKRCSTAKGKNSSVFYSVFKVAHTKPNNDKLD